MIIQINQPTITTHKIRVQFNYCIIAQKKSFTLTYNFQGSIQKL